MKHSWMLYLGKSATKQFDLPTNQTNEPADEFTIYHIFKHYSGFRIRED